MNLESCGLNLDRTFKELKPHGTLEFPCAGFSSHCTDNPASIIPWHWHEEMEFIYLETGNLKLEIPEKTFYLSKGEGFFINSNVLHFAMAQPSCELHSIVFHPALLSGNENSIFARKYITPLTNCTAFDGCRLNFDKTKKHSNKRNFIDAFDALCLEKIGYEFTVREKLSQICIALYQKYEHEIETGFTEMDQNSIRIRKMLDYIHNHFSENLDLSQIAKSADIGERESLRCFQQTVQISPIQYLLKYRIMQGASMLTHNGNNSISDIASLCGFDSPSNFSQMFKRFYQCTPREYRKNLKNNAAFSTCDK